MNRWQAAFAGKRKTYSTKYSGRGGIKATSRPRVFKKRRITIAQLTRSNEMKSVDFTDINRTLRVFSLPPAHGADLTTGFTSVFLPQQGNSYCNRIGAKVNIKSIKLEVDIGTIQVIAAPIGHAVRYMIVYDKQPNGVAPTLANIIGSTDQTNATAINMMSPAFIPNTTRFRLLRDKTVNVQAQITDNSGDGVLVHVKEYIRCNLPAHFSGTANPLTIANVMAGGLYLIMFADTASTCEFKNLNVRTRYSDN